MKLSFTEEKALYFKEAIAFEIKYCISKKVLY